MNRWQRFKQWLLGISVVTVLGFLQELLKILVPIGAVFFAFFGFKLGMQFEIIVVIVLGFLGTNALIHYSGTCRRAGEGNAVAMPKKEKG